MEPLKNIMPVTHWLFRVAMLIHGILYHWKSVKAFGFDKTFFISLVWFVLSIGLFAGGFMKTTTVTVISSLGLVILSFYYIITDFNGDFSLTLSTQLLVLSIAFYFLANGNKS